MELDVCILNLKHQWAPTGETVQFWDSNVTNSLPPPGAATGRKMVCVYCGKTRYDWSYKGDLTYEI